MNCNLVKKSVKVFNEKANKEIRLTNYYLVFDNGEIIPVECKYYTTKSTKKEDIDKISKLNSINFTKFSTLADVFKDKEDVK